jgi:putative hydrolase of the HAD superfamily
MIQAITFDFWDTLFVAIRADASRCRVIQGALERAGYKGVGEARIRHAIGRTWRVWDRVWEQEQRTFGAPCWVSLVLADLGVSLPQQEQDALVQAIATSGMEARPPLVEGVSALLPRLARDYRLGLISDTGLSPGWMLREQMASHGVLRYFSHLTFSDELEVSKPHPDAFLTTLAGLGVSPEAAVHIGDHPRTDIAGARAVGMRAVRFIGVRNRPNGAVRADAEIKSYNELEALLARWGDRAEC